MRKLVIIVLSLPSAKVGNLSSEIPNREERERERGGVICLSTFSIAEIMWHR